MRGPLPSPNARRRNAPTIPTTNLPSEGRAGPAPRPPKAYELADRGKAWWSWAWKTPQAAAWSAGDLLAIARRAALEDDLQTLEDAPELDVADMLRQEPSEASKELEYFIRRLSSMATGRLAVMKEMRELDDRLGLTPKARAALRWEIVAPQPVEEPTDGDDEVSRRREERKARLATGG